MATQTTVITPPKARFSPGRVVMTVGVNALIRQRQLNPIVYLHRHLAGDWGELSEYDKRQNNAALRSGQDRILSCYQVAPGLQLWIITEGDRSVTTLLLPDEY